MIFLNNQIATKISSTIHQITIEQTFSPIIQMIYSIKIIIIIHQIYLMLLPLITNLILITIHLQTYSNNKTIIQITYFNKTIIINLQEIIIYLINLLIFLINNLTIIQISSIVKTPFPIIISLIPIIYLINLNKIFLINLLCFSTLTITTMLFNLYYKHHYQDHWTI